MKRFYFASLISLSLALSLGVFSNSDHKEVKAYDTVDAQVYSVQVRKGEGEGQKYLVVNDHTIDQYSNLGFSDVSEFNAPQYINVYMERGGNAIKLADIIDTNYPWWCNQWQSQGIMFPIADYDTYNGISIYAIEILEGCTYPNNKFQTCRVPAKKRFINDSYGYCGEDPDPEIIKNGSFNWTNQDRDALDEPISLIKAQVRGQRHGEGETDEQDLLYIDFLSHVYDNTQYKSYLDASIINAFDKIKVYLSENDAGKTLGDITIYREVCQNQFSGVDNTPAFFFRINTANYEIYNALSIYMIEVQEGCQFFVDGMIAEVDMNYRFFNSNFGVDTSSMTQEEIENLKLSGFEFTKEVNEVVNFGNITLQGIHNRMDKDSENRWIMLLFNERIYENTSSTSVKHFINLLNFLDSVLIYFSETDEHPKTLREIYDTSTSSSMTGITIKQFGSPNTLGISILNPKDSNGKYINDGGHMYKIVIRGGAQIPTIENDIPGYRVLQNQLLVMNDEYGKFGIIDAGSRVDYIDDKDRLRCYEDWNVLWTIVPCYVSFTVVGIDGLSFPSMYLTIGQRVSLKSFEREGYDLVATTSNGDKIYQAIIGVNYSLDVILTYKIHQSDEKEETKGCAGSVTTSIGTLSIISLVSIGLILFKKRKEQ